MSIPSCPEKLDIDWRAVGRRVRELRGFDTTQSELAAALGVAQSFISAMENGQTEIGAVVLYRIARIYDKTIEWLLVGAENRPQQIDRP
jgi:transcriptional regulator with XRE-family HTH domain